MVTASTEGQEPSHSRRPLLPLSLVHRENAESKRTTAENQNDTQTAVGAGHIRKLPPAFQFIIVCILVPSSYSKYFGWSKRNVVF
jgi:hypothetical protein